MAESSAWPALVGLLPEGRGPDCSADCCRSGVFSSSSGCAAALRPQAQTVAEPVNSKTVMTDETEK